VETADGLLYHRLPKLSLREFGVWKVATQDKQGRRVEVVVKAAKKTLQNGKLNCQYRNVRSACAWAIEGGGASGWGALTVCLSWCGGCRYRPNIDHRVVDRALWTGWLCYWLPVVMWYRAVCCGAVWLLLSGQRAAKRPVP